MGAAGTGGVAGGNSAGTAGVAGTTAAPGKHEGKAGAAASGSGGAGAGAGGGGATQQASCPAQPPAADSACDAFDGLQCDYDAMRCHCKGKQLLWNCMAPKDMPTDAGHAGQ
jgi:hypothetical protein